jgi:HEAT repeat protein
MIRRFLERLFGRAPTTATSSPPRPSARRGDRVAELMRQLDRAEWTMRRSAAVELGDHGVKAERAIAPLVEARVDPRYEVREAADEALGRIDLAWSRHPRVGDAVPLLVRAMSGDRPPDVTKAAIETLDRLGVTAGPALARLVREEENVFVRILAVRAIAKLGARGVPGVAALTEALGGDQHTLREAAAQALEQIGPEAAPAAPRLVQLLDDTFAPVRRAAAEALSKLGPQAISGIPSLVRLLTDPGEGICCAAVKTLGAIGEPALLPLVAIVSQPGLREEDFGDLGRLLAGLPQSFASQHGVTAGPPPRKPLEEPTTPVVKARKAAATALGALGPAATTAVPILGQTLFDRHVVVRTAAAIALGKLGAVAKPALPELVKALGDEQAVVQQAVAQALTLLDPCWTESEGVKAAAPGLIEKLLDPSDQVRKGTMMALGRLGATAVPGLVAALGHEDRIMRQRAAEALGSLGSVAHEATPTLRQALEDSHVWVRDAAKRALERIGSPAAVPQS